ncbi:MAG TPA: PDZ domain-containing protein [Longimicrobium sp.]|jgi:S1-C subfamily serine protease|uniref:PDZ domain-containing protein n=1 Tax=Longimicrobium sp. TaxID=2029185 RepID=UPI002ED8234D
MYKTIALALMATAACAADVAGQQPGSPSAPTQRSVGAAGREGRSAAYTGIGVSGRPAPAPDGTPRWADYPLVHVVAQGSPAARVGILPGDVLLLVNGVDARDPRALFGEPGKVFTIRLRRGTGVREFVVASVRPPDPPAR